MQGVASPVFWGQLSTAIGATSPLDCMDKDVKKVHLIEGQFTASGDGAICIIFLLLS